jgi:hypothetical protein
VSGDHEEKRGLERENVMAWRARNALFYLDNTLLVVGGVGAFEDLAVFPTPNSSVDLVIVLGTPRNAEILIVPV